MESPDRTPHNTIEESELLHHDVDSFPLVSTAHTPFDLGQETISLFGKNGKLKDLVDLKGNYDEILRLKIDDGNDGGWQKLRGIGYRLEKLKDGLRLKIFFSGTFTDQEKTIVRNTVREAMKKDGILAG